MKVGAFGMTSASSLPAGWVVLCVGGTEFITTRTTLENAPNYFATLLSAGGGSFAPATTDGLGRILVDRDPEVFPHILSYLRTLDAFIPPTCPRALRLLEREAAFFGLADLLASLTERREEEAAGSEDEIVLLCGLPDSALERDLISAVAALDAARGGQLASPHCLLGVRLFRSPAGRCDGRASLGFHSPVFSARFKALLEGAGGALPLAGAPAAGVRAHWPTAAALSPFEREECAVMREELGAMRAGKAGFFGGVGPAGPLQGLMGLQLQVPPVPPAGGGAPPRGPHVAAAAAAAAAPAIQVQMGPDGQLAAFLQHMAHAQAGAMQQMANAQAGAGAPQGPAAAPAAPAPAPPPGAQALQQLQQLQMMQQAHAQQHVAQQHVAQLIALAGGAVGVAAPAPQPAADVVAQLNAHLEHVEAQIRNHQLTADHPGAPPAVRAEAAAQLARLRHVQGQLRGSRDRAALHAAEVAAAAEGGGGGGEGAAPPAAAPQLPPPQAAPRGGRGGGGNGGGGGGAAPL